MLRNVTLKPLARFVNVSPTSRRMDGIPSSLTKHDGGSKFRAFRPSPAGSLGDLQSVRFRLHPASAQGLNNLLSVKAPVLDKNFAGVPPTDHHAGQMNSRHIAFQSVPIQGRLPRNSIEPDSQAFNKRKIWLIPRQHAHHPDR